MLELDRLIRVRIGGPARGAAPRRSSAAAKAVAGAIGTGPNNGTITLTVRQASTSHSEKEAALPTTS